MNTQKQGQVTGRRQPDFDEKPKSALERAFEEEEEDLFGDEHASPIVEDSPSQPEAPAAVVSVTADGERKETELIIDKPTVFSASDFMRFAEMSKDLDKAEVGMSVAPQYYEFNTPGEKIRGVFVGYMTIRKKNKINPAILDTINCVLWISKGESFMNGGKALISRFEAIPIGTPVEIEYLKKDGEVKLFNVRLLNL